MQYVQKIAVYDNYSFLIHRGGHKYLYSQHCHISSPYDKRGFRVKKQDLPVFAEYEVIWPSRQMGRTGVSLPRWIHLACTHT